MPLFLLIYHIDIFRPTSYTPYHVSEWLINYEGGFVRRGLDGQIIYWLYNLYPFDVILAIKGINVVSSLLLLYLVFHIFRKQGWSLTILLLSCCLFYIFFQLVGRRDVALLLCVYGLFSCYKNYVFKARKWLWGSLFVLLSVFIFLSHEAFFFCSLPIIGVYALSFIYNKDVKQEGLKTYIRLFAPFIPALLTFFAVIYYKGNAEIAREIWASWTPLFRAYPDVKLSFDELEHTMGEGIKALTWNTIDTMKMHFLVNTRGIWPVKFQAIKDLSDGNPNLNTLLFFWLYISTYFLVTHLNAVKVGWWRLSTTPQTSRISQVILVQFIFMLPMFTVLSCDYGRTFPYWILSSLFALHIFGDLRLPLVAHISSKIERLCPQSPLRIKLLFMLCFVFYPFWLYYPDINSIFIIGYAKRIFTMLCAHL